MQIGTKVRLIKSKKQKHPWRRGKKPFLGRGVIEKIREVTPSSNIPDGKIYSVRLSKLTIKDYSILELQELTTS